MFKTISKSNLIKEEQCFNELVNSIREFENVVFNAGAGSGKTYALVEAIRSVIINREKQLSENNQQIICITYTNVATLEVKGRLGKSKLVVISTIHECIWEIIKKYQTELIEIHKEYIDLCIKNIENNFKENEKYTKFNDLNTAEKEEFIEIVKNIKTEFYKYESESAAIFKREIGPKLSKFENLITNVNNFKDTVRAIYKVDNLNYCLYAINNNKKGFKKIEYATDANYDVLHRMKISHDTLLFYGSRLIEKHDLLKRIIIEKFPYFFIDEYQDTNEKVIIIMNLLRKYSEQINKPFFVGYFGDTAQNIYNTGIGNKLHEIHEGLKIINKNFNRRSSTEIINVINKIRSDEINQISVYEDSKGGNVNFYKGELNEINKFVEQKIVEWNVTENNKLHCLVLTNKVVCEFSGFNNLYTYLSKASVYSSFNYDRLNPELMSNDTKKLGVFQRFLYDFINLFVSVNKGESFLKEVVPNKSILFGLNIEALSNLFTLLIECSKGNSLSEYIQSIENIYTTTADTTYKTFMSSLFNHNLVSYESFKKIVFGMLYPKFSQTEDETLEEQKFEDAKLNVENIMNIKMSELVKWFNFINERLDGSVLYHTYHGTKGKEYDNVIIVMENKFGSTNSYFDFFFKNFNNTDQLAANDKDKYEKIKNLIYVSCSRAKSNLAIYYLDEVTEFADNINNIFGDITYLEN